LQGPVENTGVGDQTQGLRVDPTPEDDISVHIVTLKKYASWVSVDRMDTCSKGARQGAGTRCTAPPHTLYSVKTYFELLLSLQVEELQRARRFESDDGSLRVHNSRVSRNVLLINAFGVDIDDVELNQSHIVSNGSNAPRERLD
jgi:hypothetical protein